MHHRVARPASRLFQAGAIVLVAVVVASCGGDKLAISKAVDNVNSQLETIDVKLTCPDTVDRDAADFDCVVQSNKTGKTAPVKYTVTGEEKDTLAPKDQAALQKSLEEIVE